LEAEKPLSKDQKAKATEIKIEVSQQGKLLISEVVEVEKKGDLADRVRKALDKCRRKNKNLSLLDSDVSIRPA
jgi:hypothetical protein